MYMSRCGFIFSRKLTTYPKLLFHGDSKIICQELVIDWYSIMFPYFDNRSITLVRNEILGLVPCGKSYFAIEQLWHLQHS